MECTSSVISLLKSRGLSVDIDRYGKLRVYPKDRITAKIRALLAESKVDMYKELWPVLRERILTSLPKDASGPSMSAERYQTLRRYISENVPTRLVDYQCGIGTVTAVTPPRSEVPAGTITMICDNGSHVDGDSRCFTYPNGQPVANGCFVAYGPAHGCWEEFGPELPQKPRTFILADGTEFTPPEDDGLDWSNGEAL